MPKLNNKNMNNLIFKKAKDLKTPHQRRYTGDKKAPIFKKKKDTATHLLKWPKFHTLTKPNAVEATQQWELSLVSGGKEKRHSHVRRQFGSSVQN